LRLSTRLSLIVIVAGVIATLVILMFGMSHNSLDDCVPELVPKDSMCL